MSLLIFALLLLVAPVQAAIATALVRDPLAAPVLPAALLAAWVVLRQAEDRPCHEVWPAVLIPAVVLGVASEERVGWFLLALLPAPAIAVAGARRLRPRVTGFWRRLSTAAGAAALGAMAYAVVLAFAAGLSGHLAGSASALLATGLGTALVACLGVVALWPLRARPRGLFG